MDRLRVLALIDGIGVTGGGERIARSLLAHLDQTRFERSLCVSRWNDEGVRDPAAAAAVAELDSDGVEFIGLQRRSALALSSWRPLLRLLRERPIDILHSHKFGSNVWGAVLGTLARTPVVVAHEHTWDYQGRSTRKLLDRELIARRADAFIAVSSEDRRRMIEIEGIEPEKVVLMPNGVPTPAAATGADVRRELAIDAGQPVVGTISMLRAQKAVDVLLRACQRLRPQFPDLRALIVGDGPERTRLEALSASLRLEEAVVFLGRRTDVADVLAALDVAVWSSDFEGAPLAILEAMEAGLPVVATRVGGVPDLIDDGVHGLLVPRRDPGALADAIARVLADRPLAAQLGRSGRDRRRSEFGIDTAARRTAELYEQLYAASPRADPSRVA